MVRLHRVRLPKGMTFAVSCRAAATFGGGMILTSLNVIALTFFFGRVRFLTPCNNFFSMQLFAFDWPSLGKVSEVASHLSRANKGSSDGQRQHTSMFLPLGDEITDGVIHIRPAGRRMDDSHELFLRQLTLDEISN